jgi:hypothetical protein
VISNCAKDTIIFVPSTANPTIPSNLPSINDFTIFTEMDISNQYSKHTMADIGIVGLYANIGESAPTYLNSFKTGV